MIVVLIRILLLILVLNLLVTAVYIYETNKCPREIERYRCRGSRCDHSRQARRDARKVMRRGGR
jgi:hypothetical protein